MKFHLNRFLRRVRIHGGEFDTSARAMYRDEVVYPLQADLRIVRRSTIERKQMSTKTTFKRIALVAVASLGFGVLSVVPSQADVSGLSVTITNGTGATVTKSGESTTAATIKVQFLALAATPDSVSVTISPAAALPKDAVIGGAGVWFTESTTSGTSAPAVDTGTSLTSLGAASIAVEETKTVTNTFRVTSPASGQNGTYSATVKYTLGETNTSTIKAGTYSFNAIVVSVKANVVTTDIYPFTITVAAAAAAAVVAPVATLATAYLQNGDASFPAGVLADSATSGSMVVGTRIGTLQVKNAGLTGAAKDTMTVTMTGVGYLVTTAPSAITGRSFVIANEESFTANIMPDGTSGTGTITITTAAGASFVKTVTFWDTKPSKAVATVAKAYIKAGTGSVTKVFSVVVSDTAGNPITSGLTFAAAPTDTATTVGGAATCGAYDTTDKVYYCEVAGLSATKFGPVAYTIKATGADAAKTVVSTTATVTFADNVATKAVLAGPASAAPGAVVDYTLTLTEKNGYPVADMVYGAGGSTLAPGGVLFATRVAAGWGATTPFATTDSFTAKSGVITSKGTMPLAGTVTGTWTLAGDGLQTLTTDAIDKTIGKTTVTASTEVANAAADAATQAAEEAAAAAQDATDAALDATTAAEAAGALAQEAVDAVAELSAEVTKLMSALKAQITYLTKLVMKLAAK